MTAGGFVLTEATVSPALAAGRTVLAGQDTTVEQGAVAPVDAYVGILPLFGRFALQPGRMAASVTQAVHAPDPIYERDPAYRLAKR
jgi:hypothetical protein